jgi:hypothetical protein
VLHFATCLNNAVSGAISSWISGLVTDALNPMFDLLGQTLLATPMPSSLPQIGYLWTNSWQIMLASYGILVLLAGITVMAYQTVQSRHGIKDMLPRVVVGFFAGTLSLFLATKAIEIANALARGILGQGVDSNTVATQMKAMVAGTQNGGIFLILLAVVLLVLVVALVVVYAIRVVITVILLAAGPLALMCHALPATEGIAFWYYRATGLVLGIQVGQSFVLVEAVRLLFAPGGFSLVPGSHTSGTGLLVNLFGAIALFYLLFRIPFWFLATARLTPGGRSLVGTLARVWVWGHIFGVLGARAGARGHGHRGGSAGGGGRWWRGGPDDGPRTGPGNGTGDGHLPDPYRRTRTTADGQYLLPLGGLRRVRALRATGSSATPSPARATSRPSGGVPRRPVARQLALPLGADWPEHRPVLGADGQYQLPLPLARRPPVSAPPTTAPAARPGGGRGAGRRLALRFDPYAGNRPLRSGQHPLPLDGLTPRRRPPTPPLLSPSYTVTHPRVGPVRRRVVQPTLPFDPYHGNRPLRSGQYPLPLDGVRRVRPARAPTPATAPLSSPAARSGARQLRLPLDLPPIRHTPPPRTPPRTTSPPSAASPTTRPRHPGSPKGQH